MVLADLGKRLTSALQKMNKTVVFDDATFDKCLKEICTALLEADVNVRLVSKLRSNIKNSIKLDQIPPGMNRRNLLRGAIVEELCSLLNGGNPRAITKGKTNVVMLVGLQGAGKTTTCTKLAYYYRYTKQYKTAVICTDTFRAGAFDQLKQNATQAKIPFYGSYVETDPVIIATKALEKFKEEKFDVVIIDTSGRHRQEAALFEEMLQITEAVKPDDIFFVMDASIGQAAEAQASAFREQVGITGVIISKLDGHSKGGGALSAVAVTRSPVVFIGTGEHLEDLEEFSPKSFIKKLLGEGDLDKLFELVKESRIDDHKDLMAKLQKKRFDLRDFYKQLQNIFKLGPLGASEIFTKDSARGEQTMLKKYTIMMDSMTDKELDSDGNCFSGQGQTRIKRVAQGSGCSCDEVEDLLSKYKLLGKMFTSFDFSRFEKNAPRDRQSLTNQLSGMFNPAMIQQMGGFQNMLNGMMKAFGEDNFGSMSKK